MLMGANLQVAWPTPNPAFAQGLPPVEYVQPTQVGGVESGMYGCVRNDGRRFHEGLDLFPLKRDSRGEADEPIFAVMAGTVRFINGQRGRSSYGLYVVLEHPQQRPAVYTLYSHLESIEPGLRVGQRVAPAAVLGRMGRTATGYSIPRHRAHLHFEIGVRMTDRFQPWYDRQRFKSPNRFGNYNGMNLRGLDPHAFFVAYRAGELTSLQDYFDRQPVAAVVGVRSTKVPDYVRRYPSLLTTSVPGYGLAGWIIAFDPSGIPLALTPVKMAEIQAWPDPKSRAQILYFNHATAQTVVCRDLLSKVNLSRQTAQPGESLTQALELMFGWR